MKVYEILNEAISLTTEKGNVKQIILEAIHRFMKHAYKILLEEIEEGKITSFRPLWRRLDDLIIDEFSYTVVHLLMAKYHKSPYGVSHLMFDPQMHADGECEKSRIKIKHKWLDNLQKIMLELFQVGYGDNPAFREDGSIDKDALWNACTYYKGSHYIDKAIAPITNYFIHELVHVQQHNTQTELVNRKGTTEYRSYLTKNRKEFLRAVIYKATKYDMQIYHASPQEIDAFAHNMAIELIHDATIGIDIEDMNDSRYIENLEGMLFSIQEVMKHREFKYSGTYTDRYQEFNDPKNKLHYKVYKRFMKKVYLEVQRYIEKLKVQITKFKNRPDDWFMYD